VVKSKESGSLLCEDCVLDKFFSFFPIPPDLMLIPMVQAKREAWWRYALIATIFSVLGGIAGYLIGMFFFDAIAQPMSGALKINFGVFVAASVLARSLRFFLVAGSVRLFGERAEKLLKEHFQYLRRGGLKIAVQVPL